MYKSRFTDTIHRSIGIGTLKTILYHVRALQEAMWLVGEVSAVSMDFKTGPSLVGCRRGSIAVVQPSPCSGKKFTNRGLKWSIFAITESH